MMRDIRQDLDERLQALRSEKEQLQKRLGSMERQEQILEALIEDERRRWSELQAPLSVKVEDSLRGNGKDRTPLAQLILEKLADSNVWTAKEIAAEAVSRGFPFGEKSPNRSLHFALVGMAQSGIVEGLGNGRWRMKQK